ncbi:glycosyltransferase family 2 protein [Rufibacter psychrotolerans]|uniref:glycosyltransferase family 2 protein n=1 Tax=Rufibacter psychrotolerans TaxID=2812556 RepID=UPI001967ABD1|nr:glycosyltransferase family 2 protein [Rufibacter sp. SYSU D00308]
MNKHWPYHITHLSLDKSISVPPLLGKNQGNYLVFWWKNLPLGHLILGPNALTSEARYYAQLLQAIKPAIERYNTSSLAWEQALLAKNFQEWKNCLEPIMEPHTAAPVPAQVPVSVVICTRNRPKQLQKCLKQLKTLVCLPEEIIVVDNAPSDDSSQKVAQPFREVTYVREPRAGLDIARNTGIQQASCPIVAYLDDDVVVHPLWVYQVWDTFQNPGTAAMTGLVLASELETEAQYLFEKHWSFNRGYTDKVFDAHFFQSQLTLGPPVWDIGAGANMAFRKSALEEVGYFDEVLDVGAAGCSGDSEMWFRLLAHGHAIHYNPRAVVHHEHRKDLKGLRKQIFYYMRGFTTAALLQQQQVPTANYQRRLFRVIPKHYYLMVVRGFPRYQDRNRTLWAEIKGILSGYSFYLRNRKKSTIRQEKPVMAPPLAPIDLKTSLQ